MWDTILWVIAFIVGLMGVVRLFQRQVMWGIILFVAALLIGPGGVGIFT